MIGFSEVRGISWRTAAEMLGITEPTAALTGASAAKYLAGDGSWQTTPTLATLGAASMNDAFFFALMLGVNNARSDRMLVLG